jgi:hypothetical protein
MSINWKIVGSFAVVVVLAYFVYDSNRLGGEAPVAIDTVITQEPQLAAVTSAFVEVASEPIIMESEPVYPFGINYLSVEDAFEATEQQALELLEDYKFHLSQDTAESHFGIYGIKSSCMGINFYTQRDLDSWIAEDKWALGREAMEFEAINLMKRVARCREVVTFIGDEEMNDADDQIAKSLIKSAELGHPMGKLFVNKNSDPKNMAILFTDAYEYSKDFPQFKVDVYSMALRYVKRYSQYENNPTYMALYYMALRDGFIFNEVVDPSETVNDIQDVMESDLRPLEIDAVHQKRKEISEAMENGDWSWLLTES